jgi:hypothetical protein
MRQAQGLCIERWKSAVGLEKSFLAALHRGQPRQFRIFTVAAVNGTVNLRTAE